MSHRSLLVQCTQEKKKQAYDNQLRFEILQYRQELTRKTLGAPFGRAPPPKLTNIGEMHESFSLLRAVNQSLGLSTEIRSSYEPIGDTFSLDLMSPRSPTHRQTLDPLSARLDQSVSGLARAHSGPISLSFTDSDLFDAQAENPFSRPSGKNHFFPTEMFIDWTAQDRKYPVRGFAKRRMVDDSVQWVVCSILRHDESTRKFEIQWEDSGVKKLVAREALRFDDESEEQYRDILVRANRLKQCHEGFLRYFSRLEIDLSQAVIPRSSLYLSMQAEILRKLALPLGDRKAAVKEEMWELYRRSVFQFVFDSQYFAKVQGTIRRPWQDDLKKQLRWREVAKVAAVGSFPYAASAGALEQRIMDRRNPLHTLRVLMHQRLTRLRTIDLYAALNELRQTARSLVELKESFAAKYSKALFSIDKTVKFLLDQVFKVLEADSQLNAEADEFMKEAEIVLESNLQFAVKRSIKTLISFFSRYYQVTPVPLGADRYKQLPPEFLSILRGEGSGPVPPISQIKSTAIVKETLALLYKDLADGQLFRYSLVPAQVPLISLRIDAKETFMRVGRGKQPKFFRLKDIDWELTQRRGSASPTRQSSPARIPPRQVLSDSLKLVKTLHNIMHITAECRIDPDSSPVVPRRKSLLDEAAFGWVSAGKDKFSVDVSPSLDEVEQTIVKLFKAPLTNAQRIQRFSCSSTSTAKIRVKNAATELATALSHAASVLQYSLYGPIALLAMLREFDYLFAKRINEPFFRILNSHVDDYLGLVAEIRAIARHKEVVETGLPDTIQFGLFLVQLKYFKLHAVTNAEALRVALLKTLSNEHLATLQSVTALFQGLIGELTKVPQRIEDLEGLLEFVEKNQDEVVMQEVRRELAKVQEIEDSFDSFHETLSEEQRLLSWKTKTWETHLAKEKQRMQRRLQRLIPTFQDSMKEQVAALQVRMGEAKRDMAEFATFSDLQYSDKYATVAEEVLVRIQKLKADVEIASKREQILKLPKSDFRDLALMEAQFASFPVFWSYASEWASAYTAAMDKPLAQVDPDALQTKFDKGIKLVEKMKGEMMNNVNVMRAVADLEQNLKGFETTLPLIFSLRSEAMRERHWKKIWERLGRIRGDRQELDRRQSQTLRELLNKNILRHAKYIEFLASEARSEHEVEKIWTSIEKATLTPDLEVSSHQKYPELQVLARLDDKKERLHEFSTTVKYLTKSNRYIEPFKEQLKQLELTINTQLAFVEDLHEFQELLVVLYPVFRIPEMCEQMPRTAARLSEAVEYFHMQLQFMVVVTYIQNKVVGTKVEGRFGSFPEATAELRKVREDIALKLAEKQEAFTRLYFLTNFQLLELMHDVSSQQCIDVCRLFPGVERLASSERAVTGFVRNGVLMPLKKEVVIAVNTHPISLEDWLQDLERVLQQRYSALLASTLSAFSLDSLAGDQDPEVRYVACYLWVCQRVQSAVDSANAARGVLRELAKQLRTSLETVVDSIRTRKIIWPNPDPHKSAQSPPKPCEEIANLLLSHTNLVYQLIESPAESLPLHWKSTLKLRESPDSKEYCVDCFDYSVKFGYEMHSVELLQSYVLTGAVDRRAVHLYLALQGKDCLMSGEMGSEKAEAARFLSVICGRMLAPLFLTSSTPYDRISKHFLACVSGGCWCLLDSAHSISPLHLTTVAKHAQSVRTALLAGVSRVAVDGVTVRPRTGFALICTTNWEVEKFPQTVREDFRVVRVLKPDWSTVANVILQVNGVPRAMRCSRLIAKTMDLFESPIVSLLTGASVNLHLKSNYRTLTTIVRCFLTLVEAHPKASTQYCLNNTFRLVYGAGLAPADLAVLDEFLASVFQSLHNDKVALFATSGDHTLKAVAAEGTSNPEVLEKRIWQLHNLLYLGSRPWVFVIGPHGSGKTLTIHLTAKLSAGHQNAGLNVHKLGPVLTQQALIDLCACLATSASAWFAPTLNESYLSVPTGPQQAKYSDRDWVHVDAKTIPYSADLLNYISKAHSHTKVKVLFETENLATADPAVVSISGILPLSQSDLDPVDCYMSVVRTVCVGKLEVWQEALAGLYQTIMIPVLAHFADAAKTMRVDEKFIIDMFGKILAPLLQLILKKAEMEENIKAIPLGASKGALVLLKRMSVDRKHSVPPVKPLEQKPVARSGLQFDLLKHIGSVRKPRTIKPLNTVEAVYFLAVMASFGNLILDSDRFNSVLLDLLKSQSEEFACFLVREHEKLKSGNLLDLTFSVKTLTWIRIFDIYSSEPVPGLGRQAKGSILKQPEHSLTFFESTAVRYQATSVKKDSLLVPTASTQRLSYWVEFCFRNKLNIAVFGPHQSGKSAVVMAVAKELMELSFSSVIPVNVSALMTCDIVQDMLESSMENRRRRHFGGVGGAHFYAVLDDMNLDASNSVYDLFRFWKESGGWYKEGFTHITDLTVAFVHSFTDERSRKMWLRAMRHFFLIYKQGYGDGEMTTIFRHYIDSGASGEEMDSDGMMSVADESIHSFVRLFALLAKEKTEQTCCQVTITNFAHALRFLAQFAVSVDLDLALFLKMWTFLIYRYFVDQFGDVASIVKDVVSSSLQTLYEKCLESSDEAFSVLSEGLLIPTEQQLHDDSLTLFSDFEPVSAASMQRLMAVFQESMKACEATFPQRMKHVHSLLFSVEDKLAAYIYFFVNVLYDVKSALPSVIIRTQSQTGLIKALICAAVQTLRLKVFEFTSEEKEDAFTVQLIDSFKSFSPTYIPTESRFEVKRIMVEAMLENRKTAVIIALQDRAQLERTITRRYLDIVLDAVMGVRVKLSGFDGYYREFVEKFRESVKDTPDAAHLYTDEIMQTLLERMRTNVTFFFIISSPEDTWSRSPLHSSDLLETFKHEYRRIFNLSRVVNFDGLQPPRALKQWVATNEELLREWRIDFCSEVLMNIEEELGSENAAEKAQETIAFCCQSLLASLSSARESRLDSLRLGLSKLSAVQSEIAQLESTRDSLQSAHTAAGKSLTKAREKLAAVESELRLPKPFAAELNRLVESEREALSADWTSARTAWEAAVDACPLEPEDFADTDKLLSSPNTAKVLYLFCALVNEHHGEFPPRDKVDSVVLKFLPQLTQKWKKVTKKLKSMPPDAITEMIAEVDHCDSRVKGGKTLRGIWDILTASVAYRAGWQRHSSALARLDHEQSQIPSKAAELAAQQTASLQQSQSRLQAKIASKVALAQKLSTQMVFLSEKSEELLELRLTLANLSRSWEEQVATIESDRRFDLGDSIATAYFVTRAAKFAGAERDAVLTTVAETLKSHRVPSRGSEFLARTHIPDYPQFLYTAALAELCDSGFYRQSAGCLAIIFRLGLPFPLIYDPFDVARKYIARAEGNVLVWRVSADGEFDRKLREHITEGRPVLVEDPSLSLLKSIQPVVFWRGQVFLQALRGMPLAQRMKTPRGELTVHPDFRLYVCVTEEWTDEQAKYFTKVSFEAVDQESWESVLAPQLLKSIDRFHHKSYLSYIQRRAQQTYSAYSVDSSLLSALVGCDPPAVLQSPALSSLLAEPLKKVRGRPSVDEQVVLQKPQVVQLLAESFALKGALAVCAEALEDYDVAGRRVYREVVGAAEDVGRDCREGLVEDLAERVTYATFIRLTQSLPSDKSSLFSFIFAVHRQRLRDPTIENELLQLLADLIRALTSPYDPESGLKYLRTRYSVLFPSNFSANSAAFRAFLEKETYAEAKVPDSVPTLHKSLLYAYLRQDLLHSYLLRCVQETLGPRYAYIPALDYRLGVEDAGNFPTVVFYEKTSPKDLIRRLGEMKNAVVVFLQPEVNLMGNAEGKAAGRSSEAIISALAQNPSQVTYTVLENLPLVSGLDAEYLTKSLLAHTADDYFRVFALFPGRPMMYPHWKTLIHRCRRVVVSEPRIMSDALTTWFAGKDSELFRKFCDLQKRRLWSRSEALSLLPTALLLRPEMDAVKPSPSRKNSEIPLAVAGKNQQMTYSLSFLTAVLSIRNVLRCEFPTLFPSPDLMALLGDFQSCLSPLARTYEVLNPRAFALFCDLLAPQLSHSGTAVCVHLAASVLMEEKPSLVVKGDRLGTLEYPLNLSNWTTDFQAVVQAVARFPSEDHPSLYALTPGLPQSPSHVLLVSALSSLQTQVRFGQHITGSKSSLSVARQKEAVSVRLQHYLKEILAGLPEVLIEDDGQAQASVNTIVKRQGEWFSDSVRDGDLRNTIMDSALPVEVVLAGIQRAEGHRRNAFIQHVRKAVQEMFRYLSYNRSALSPDMSSQLLTLATGTVPAYWLSLSPFAAQRGASPEVWRPLVLQCFQHEVSTTALDFRVLFAPCAALWAVLRGYVLDQRYQYDAERSRADIFDPQFYLPSPTLSRSVTLDQTGFIVDFADSADRTQYQVLVTGLYIRNARIDGKTGMLEDAEGRTECGPLLLTPTQLPKSLRNSAVYPSGLKLIVRQALESIGGKGKWDPVSQLQLAKSENSNLQKPRRKRESEDALIYSPVEVDLEGKVWLLAQAKETQARWSRRSVALEL